MSGLIGKKIGMTSIYDSTGKNAGATILWVGPCAVTQVKSKEVDGYNAVQLAFDDDRQKNVTKPREGHFRKAGVTPKRKLAEFKGFRDVLKPGDTVTASIFEEGEWVDIVGCSKGKGFQGVVKRHGFSGVGYKHHGQHDRERAPGSIGNSSFASRVFKGMRMAGRTGGRRVKAVNLYVLKVLPEKNIILVKGAVPGPAGSYVLVEKV